MMQHPHMQQQQQHQMQHLAGHPHAMHMQMQGAVLNPATGELANAQFAHPSFANAQVSDGPCRAAAEERRETHKQRLRE
eukprot:3439302-Pyramimonas_sp.AAC.1